MVVSLMDGGMGGRIDRRRALAAGGAAALAGLLPGRSARGAARELKVAMMAVSGQQRTILIETMEGFERRHREIIVRFDQLEHETYKERFEQLAGMGGYDVMFWFGGERLAAAVQAGLVRAAEEVPGSEPWRGRFPRAIATATEVDGRAFALPLSYYNWGFYYPRPLFDRLGLAPPRSWDGLLETGERLQAAGVVPFALGSRFPWTLAGWYDYLDLRLNGLAHHLAQLRGERSFDLPETRRVLETWGGLFRRGWFPPDHAEMDWRGALPGLMRGHAGMVLMGNFIVSQLPPAQRAVLGYFPFPEMDPAVPRAENAPTDVLIVPRAATNLREAGLFLSYMAEPDVQARFNGAIGQLAPRAGAEPPGDPLLRAGAETVAAAAGVAQFFDRDARPAIRDAGLAAFAAFSRDPGRVEETVAALEQARLSITR